jgi:adenylylsulfate kinase
MKVTKLRSLLKTISWRIVGTLDTMFLGWIITGSPLVGLKIGALELFTKMVLYYFHERIWLQSKYGTQDN